MRKTEILHKPVLLKETIKLLNVKKDGIYVDGTAGFGGHSRAILDRLENGRLIMIDQDPDAVAYLKKNFKSNLVSVIKGNFSEVKSLLKSVGVSLVDGVLLDVGVSSFQIENFERGFSYHDPSAPLDMRMSKEGKSAEDVINNYKEEELLKVIWKYSQERFSKRIAREIVKRRKVSPITTAGELVDVIKSAVPAKFLRKSSIHPARRTFQAIRIEVNGELSALDKGLTEAFDSLKVNGRLAVITFHSLEDKIVKKRMVEWCRGCICPADFPICVCKHSPVGKLITKRAIVASLEELAQNSRGRSARLRAVCSV
ncbi:MAG: 16S rRNA (cytosine(1402)-N(4))-methyltransferase RsmH [Oscillospiraceae bacterium]|nr:16S rRNA (cytosine(1402)-N(4))-methyltransferase RsmH [Oscillospiraceae bacterium]